MPKEGRSGLVIPVPAADELLASVAVGHSGVVREGVPAHVSILYPFVPDLDDDLVAELGELFAEQPPLAVSFAESRRHGGFVYLRPEPVDAVGDLIATVRKRWPDVVPYEGAYEDVGPHLTVAMRATDETAAVIAREVEPWLPITAELGEAWLVTFDGQWGLRGRFRFTGAAGRPPRTPG